MVEIAMGQDDERELARRTAGACQLAFKRGALVGTAGVDEEKAGVTLQEVAVDRAQPEGE